MTELKIPKTENANTQCRQQNKRQLKWKAESKKKKLNHFQDELSQKSESDNRFSGMVSMPAATVTLQVCKIPQTSSFVSCPSKLILTWSVMMLKSWNFLARIFLSRRAVSEGH